MALLTPSELAWLRGEKLVSNGYERFMRHSIRKKLTDFYDYELPLILTNASFDVVVSEHVSANSNAGALVAQPGRVEGEVNSNNEIMREESLRWDTRRRKALSDPRPRVYETYQNVGSCLRIPPKADRNFTGFASWIQKERRKGVGSQLVNYAKKYGDILDSGNASILLTLSPKSRQHAMRALANLSKYYGCYDHWKSIKQKYDLKWTTGNDLDVFKSMVDDQHNYTAMVSWLKDACSKIPEPYANILLFDVLTGLRPDEACQSIALLRSQADKYLNKDNMTLEHYKFPDTFIRTTKKAYISIIDERILTLAEGAHNGGYNSLRLRIRAAGLEMHMKYCRTIFSTYLRMHGIESELIDLLQGRIPRTVFARHYFRPDFDKDMKRIRKRLEGLHAQIA